MKIYLYIGALLFTFSQLQAQSSVLGIKSGLSLGFQQWNSIDQDALFGFNISAYIETLDNEDDKSSLLAQVGFHQRGSAKRNVQLIDNNGNFSGNVFTRNYLFNNVALELGFKSRLGTKASGARIYYMLALRGEYTLSTNLSDYEVPGLLSFDPIDAFVRKLNYGFTFGGGLEKQFSKYFGLMLELSVQPDLSYQYREEYGSNPPTVINPYTGNPITLRDRKIRNLSFEITLGLRFLREVVYVD